MLNVIQNNLLRLSLLHGLSIYMSLCSEFRAGNMEIKNALIDTLHCTDSFLLLLSKFRGRKCLKKKRIFALQS